MKFISKSIIILMLISLTSVMVKKNGNSKHYVFKSKYEYSSITLFDNGKFIQSKHGCTYAFTCKGQWVKNGDTIQLNQEKFKKTRGYHELQANRFNRLLTLNDSSVIFMYYAELGFEDFLVMHLKHE